MAKRTLDSSFWDDEDVATLSFGERLLLICMFTDVSLSDDFGCLPANPKTLRKHAFGYDDDVTSAQVREWRGGILSKCSNVILYIVEGQEYIFLKKFEQWQGLRYHRESNLPRPQGQIFPPDDEPEDPPQEPKQDITVIPETLQEIAESSQNVSNNSESFPLCSVELNRIELSRAELGCVPTAQNALPAPSTAPTALKASLSNTDSEPPVPRTSTKPPALPPTNPPENATLTRPEIAHLVNATVGFYSEIMRPRAPTPDDMQAIRNMGKLWGYKHVYMAFQDSARGSSPYRTIPEIYSHLGDNGNGHGDTASAAAGG